MANKVYEYYEGLPSWARGVVIVGGLVVVYIVGYTIYKKIQTLASSADTQNKLNQINDDLNSKLKQGQQPTFSSTQYNNFADEITAAFTGCDWSSPIIPVPTLNSFPFPFSTTFHNSACKQNQGSAPPLKLPASPGNNRY